MAKFENGLIVELDEDEIFVFGSNLAGRHGAGAALQARMQFGAVLGVGEGLTGQCYAFPTLDEHLRQREWWELLKSRDKLYETCRQEDRKFLLTKVGCGLGGYSEDEMKLLFLAYPENLIKPDGW